MKPDLPDKLLPLAQRIVIDLKRRREEGVYFPGHGCTAARIAEGYSRTFQFPVTERDIRRIVQYARNFVKGGAQIGGTPEAGYYYCLTRQEMESTIAHLVSEVASRNETIHRLRHAFDVEPDSLFESNTHAETEKVA